MRRLAADLGDLRRDPGYGAGLGGLGQPCGQGGSQISAQVLAFQPGLTSRTALVGVTIKK